MNKKHIIPSIIIIFLTGCWDTPVNKPTPNPNNSTIPSTSVPSSLPSNNLENKAIINENVKLEFAPGSKGIVGFSPSSKGIAEFSPTSKGVLEFSPSSKGVSEFSPSSKGVVNFSPSSKGIYEFAPSSKGVVEFSPSSKGIYEFSPSSKGIQNLRFDINFSDILKNTATAFDTKSNISSSAPIINNFVITLEKDNDVIMKGTILPTELEASFQLYLESDKLTDLREYKIKAVINTNNNYNNKEFKQFSIVKLNNNTAVKITVYSKGLDPEDLDIAIRTKPIN
ncbi:MAG: hypothetical protein U0457_02235 [Candidatus Sericytochromatia bacterium]